MNSILQNNIVLQILSVTVISSRTHTHDLISIDYHTTEYAEKKPFFTLFLIYDSNLPRNSFIRGFSELNTSSGLPSSTITPLSMKTT